MTLLVKEYLQASHKLKKNNIPLLNFFPESRINVDLYYLLDFYDRILNLLDINMFFLPKKILRKSVYENTVKFFS